MFFITIHRTAGIGSLVFIPPGLSPRDDRLELSYCIKPTIHLYPRADRLVTNWVRHRHEPMGVSITIAFVAYKKSEARA